MLLIFFLVTSSMDTDKGLMRQLAPLPDEKQQPQDIRHDHVATVRLDAHDQLSLDGTLLTPQQLTEQLTAFIANDPEEHVIAVETDRQTTYEAYYRMQNAIVRAYGRLRAEGSRSYPYRISEQPPKEGGGE